MIDLPRVITTINTSNIVNECKRVTTTVSTSMGGKPLSTMGMLL